MLLELQLEDYIAGDLFWALLSHHFECDRIAIPHPLLDIHMQSCGLGFALLVALDLFLLLDDKPWTHWSINRSHLIWATVA
jgi:hypothetical protein